MHAHGRSWRVAIVPASLLNASQLLMTNLSTDEREPIIADAGALPQRPMFVAALLQVAAIFTPAVRVRILGTIPFLRLPKAGVVLLILAMLSVAAAFRPSNRWRWLPGVLSASVVGVAYWRIVTAPSGSFVDPLLRRAVHPAWGFALMSVAVACSIAAAFTANAPRSTAASRM